MRNDPVAQTPTHSNFTDDALARAVAEISAETGFVSEDHEVQRRFLYDRDKTWRVRFKGVYQGRPVLLRVENLKLKIDEEIIRQAFREQADGRNVRPPHTYASRPYDDTKGYAWSLDEFVTGESLFLPTMRPERPARDFARFYRALREAVTKPFWPVTETDAEAFSTTQLANWRKLVQGSNPAMMLTRHAEMLDRLEAAIVEGVRGKELRFMHPHLAGTDVRWNRATGEYVVFANHYWSARQPGYDLSFPIWGQWLALPAGHRSVEAVEDIMTTWLTRIASDLSDLVDVKDVRIMLLNRVFGSLILDLPGIARRTGESSETVAPLENALVAVAERLLV